MNNSSIIIIRGQDDLHRTWGHHTRVNAVGAGQSPVWLWRGWQAQRTLSVATIKWVSARYCFTLTNHFGCQYLLKPLSHWIPWLSDLIAAPGSLSQQLVRLLSLSVLAIICPGAGCLSSAVAQGPDSPSQPPHNKSVWLMSAVRSS